MSNLQKKIQSLLEQLVAEGGERGAQVAVYHRGKLIVNAWAGVANVKTSAPVTENTLFPVFSTTKGITATIIHLLAERGRIDYDVPVAAYWPEFAVKGKETITVRQVMNHTAGLPYAPMEIGYAEVCDWSKITAAVANLAPSFPPGQNLVYHPLTYGWLLGEVARRVDGRPVGQLVQEEICRPLGIKTMFIGVPAALEPGVAFLEEIPDPNAPAPAPVDPAAPAGVPCWMLPLYTSMNRPDVRQACSPGSNGVMNAAAVARHYASLLRGGVDGVELLPSDRVREATVVQPPAAGYAETENNRFALGYGTGVHLPDMGMSPTAFGHNGYGGSIGFADPKYSLALGVVRNRFSTENLSARMVKEVLSSLSLC